MVTMFINTLPAPYYNKVVRNVAFNFADLVVVGERIELGTRHGKFTQTSSNASFTKKVASKKKKGETNVMMVEPVFPQEKANAPSYPTQVHIGSRQAAAYTNPPPTNVGATTNSRPAQQGTRRLPRTLAPIPMPYAELLPLLLEQKLVEIIPLKPLESPYPRSYDPNARCDYHGRVVGHATKMCWSLKHKVQDLLDSRLLGFQDQGPNVQNNPLPVHIGVAINAISHKNRDKDEGAGKREEEENAAEFASVAYIEGNDNPRPKPLIIQYNSTSKPRVPFIIQVLAKPVYNNNAVPWRYLTGETVTPLAIKESPVLEVTNIAGTSRVTLSDKIFTLESLWNKDLVHAKKDRAPEMLKRIVTEGGAKEFLKVIRHSEYEMLDQLHKTLACVSLLYMLINLEGHRNLLLKVLNDAHVAQDITPEKFEGTINNITTSRHLSFYEDEIPIEGRGHNQPLHIVVKCGNYMIVRVLIDNGSSLNVMPKVTLDKLYSTGSTFNISLVVVRAFDGSKQKVMGKITLPTHIGLTTFDITFQVMDIRPAYNCLLGRPWIHAAGEVPSSLHQKVKFVAHQQLASVMGEKELMINTPLPTKYVKGDEEALETSFPTLEIVGITSSEAKEGGSKLSKVAIMVAKVLNNYGFQPNKGLGKDLDGIVELVALQENPRRFGLGYTGTTERRLGQKVAGMTRLQCEDSRSLFH
ncbi:hypothetical protein CR513_21598, partial [Mucuna pruriens]